MSILRAREIFNDAGRVLIAIECVDVQYSKTNTGCRMVGDIKPIAVIVCSAEATCALDMQAKPTDVDQLRRDVPELDTMLASFTKD